jgi:hypothetical protein
MSVMEATARAKTPGQALNDVARERVLDLLKRHPDASNRALSRLAGIDDKTIGRLRREVGSVSPFLKLRATADRLRTVRTLGKGSDSREGAEGGAEAIRHPQRAPSRDEAVSSLCHLIKRADGLQDGLRSLACIFQDERGQIQALPLYFRRQIAHRLKEALGAEAFQA